jgi:myo-inositol-1(or 4)-monophosphatase
MTESSPVLMPDLIRIVKEAAVEAGRMALAQFREGERTTAKVWSKAGGSPVTEADVAVDAFLKVSCAVAVPSAAWLSEETADDPARLSRRLVWVVDPIDGTRAFLEGHRDWCVCVALLADGEPVLGVVHAPALGVTYEALKGEGARRNGAAIAVGPLADLASARIAGPKPMLDALARAAHFEPAPKVPSLALRLTRIAEGALDGGIVSPDSRDWDLAAADLVLREAGGLITGLDGAMLAYNRPRPVHATLVAAGNALHPPLLQAANAMRAQAMARG